LTAAVMRRATFLLLGAAPLVCARAARAQNEADPASSSRRQALRVLLGPGDALPISAQTFSFDGRSYRGSFQRLDDGQVVNIVDLEWYLYSVVSREMPQSWPTAALQAQAICGRTYVLQRSDPRRAYDLVPSEVDQVYEGIDGETPSGTAAVDATAGQVLSFGSSFAQVAYSSCCGGHTESSADAWGRAPIPYLAGVVCAWCVGSPHYRWTTGLAFEVIGARLESSLPPLAVVHDLRVTERDGSGRARAFELVADRSSVVVPASAFRRAVGTRVLPSLLVTNVDRSPDGASVIMGGGGLGHGVGLCQWGARGMALAGRGASEILTFYFPGTVVRTS
jgi:stage II sporulation protein D